jgi:hypothetical protein
MDTYVPPAYLENIHQCFVCNSGSADLWVASSSCVQGCGGIMNTFNTSKSSTFKDSHQPIDIKYGSGEVVGEIGDYGPLINLLPPSNITLQAPTR